MYFLLSLLTWIIIGSHRDINSERIRNIMSAINVSVSGLLFKQKLSRHNLYLTLISQKNVPDSPWISFPRLSHRYSPSFNSFVDFFSIQHSALTLSSVHYEHVWFCLATHPNISLSIFVPGLTYSRTFLQARHFFLTYYIEVPGQGLCQGLSLMLLRDRIGIWSMCGRS